MQIEAPQCAAHGERDPPDIEYFIAKREVRRDHRHVSQRQYIQRRNEYRAAAHLDGVLRSADHGGADSLVGALDARSPPLHPIEDRGRKYRAKIAKDLLLASVEVLRHAAGEGDGLRLAFVAQRLETHQCGGPGTERRAVDDLEKTVSHARDHPGEPVGVRFAPDFQDQTRLFGKTLPAFLDPLHAPLRVEAHDTRADVDGGHLHDLAVLAYGYLRGAAADVDIHHARRLADGAGRGSGTEGGKGSLEPVACAHRHELAGLGREQFADRARIAPARGDAGEDERAGIDQLRIDPCLFILAVDEAAESRRIDDHVLGRVVDIGCEQHLGFVHDRAFGHDVTVVQPLEHQARKDQVGCRRAYVNTDADQANLVLHLEAAPDIGKEHTPARRFIAHRDARRDFACVAETVTYSSLKLTELAMNLGLKPSPYFGKLRSCNFPK